MGLFTERHEKEIVGVLSCFDRVVITGTIPEIGFAGAMTGYLFRHNVRIFDYTKWADPLREELRKNAESLAEKYGLEIEFIPKNDFRKEKRVREIVAERGSHPGLVHIFSAMEPCSSYKPWHDKETHKTFVKPCPGKCLHYYFYLILPDLGLCYLRVPTWAPFRLQFYYNGHNELAAKSDKNGIAYKMIENAFLSIEDFPAAQKLADAIRPNRLHQRLDQIVREYCPVIRHFHSGYHWSLMQVEYATDIVFRKQEELAPIYEELVRTAVHSVKPDHIATFLGANSPKTTKMRWAVIFTPALKEPASSTTWANSPSRCTTNKASSCVSKQLPTMSPFSSTTARWNTAMGPLPAKSRRSKNPSTAYRISSNSCSPPTAATSSSFLRLTIQPSPSKTSTRSPNPLATATAAIAVSTSSTARTSNSSSSSPVASSTSAASRTGT